MYKQDLALNNQQWLICHRTQLSYLKQLHKKCKYECNSLTSKHKITLDGLVSLKSITESFLNEYISCVIAFIISDLYSFLVTGG